MNKKVLILTPDLKLTGGVATYYRGLLNHWTMNVQYYTLVEGKNDNKLFDFVRSFFYYFSFFFYVIKKRPKIVVFNASVKKGFYSSIPYVLISKILFRKTLLFIHGWDEHSEYLLKTKKTKLFFNNIDGIIVLSEQFKNKLNKIGYSRPIYMSSTKVEDDLLKDFDISKRVGKIKRFLFSARLSKAKGVMEMLDTFKLLSLKYPDISLDIVGTGDCDEEAKTYVEKEHIPNVSFYGWLSGDELAQKYIDADFFLFLSYTEGMPASILEAMAFGLPIATRPVGAIPDFFKNDINGILSKSLDPYFYSKEIIKLINDSEKAKEMSLTNYRYAKENFMASVVAAHLEELFCSIK